MSQKRVDGVLSTGCGLCEEGKKAVYFITGKCNNNCYYCPISKKRKDKNRSWINENRVEQKKRSCRRNKENGCKRNKHHWWRTPLGARRNYR